jgi:hypothetical protein
MPNLSSALFDRRPALGMRLITQNLLTSAASLEWSNDPDWLAVQDFSLLVDHFLLYDGAIVVGKGVEAWMKELDSSIYDLLERTQFISTTTLDASLEQNVACTARQHLVAFLGKDASVDYDELFRFSLDASHTSYDLSYIPDGREEIKGGQRWLLTSPSTRALIEQIGKESHYHARGVAFLLRTFLYLAYADVTKTPFTPDSARAAAVETVLAAETRFRDELRTAMSDAWRSRKGLGDEELRRQVSPLAAVVLERAAPEWSSVIQELQHLREELAPLRKRLREAEWGALWGTDEDSIMAKREWEAAQEEIGRSFGHEPHLITLKRGVAFSEALGELADKPTSYSSWLSAVLSLPLEIVSRMHARRPAIELHRLRRDLPAVERLRGSLRQLLAKQHRGS